MIRSDQPTCFPADVTVAVSSKSDNTMLDRARGFHEELVLQDRIRFCQQVGVAYEACVFQLIRYDDQQTYDHTVAVHIQDTVAYTAEVAADGLFTTERGVGLFLPVADCVAAVMYDPVKRCLGMFHLGRHSTYANLATCAVKYFTEQGSKTTDIIIWMSPSAGADSYRLDWFDYEDDPAWKGFYTKSEDGFLLDLAGYNHRRFVAAGVLSENITTSKVDTMVDSNYFSHSNGDVSGRIAVVAMMR